MSMSRLRVVFDKFDVDKSGCVSTDEMTQMVKSLKLNLTASDIKQLMKDADPDGSGSIEFEEFASVLKAQLKAGKGACERGHEAAPQGCSTVLVRLEEPTRSAAPSSAPATTPRRCRPSLACPGRAPRRTDSGSGRNTQSRRYSKGTPRQGDAQGQRARARRRRLSRCWPCARPRALSQWADVPNEEDAGTGRPTTARRPAPCGV